MKNRYSEIMFMKEGFNGLEDGNRFSAGYPLFFIKMAWNKGMNVEDLADGYGKGMGTNGDWSAIRDSSETATGNMFERAINFLEGLKAK